METNPRLSRLRRLLTPVQYLIGHLSVGLLISIVCLLAFGSIAEDLVEKDTMHFDETLATVLHAEARPMMTTFFLTVTRLGSEGVIILGAVVGLIFVLRRRWLNLLIWAIALGGGELLNLLLKTVFARPRPIFDTPLTVAQFFSFPSGHAMMSLITYGLLAYFAIGVVRSRRWRIVIVATAALLILLIGFSRLYLGAHFLTDVVGGFAAGWVWLVTCTSALRFGTTRLGQRLEKASTTAQ